MAENHASEQDIENVLKLLDGFGQSEVSRFKVTASENLEPGQTVGRHHLGRCDIGSPWATGQAFDVLEDADNPSCN